MCTRNMPARVDHHHQRRSDRERRIGTRTSVHCSRTNRQREEESPNEFRHQFLLHRMLCHTLALTRTPINIRRPQSVRRSRRLCSMGRATATPCPHHLRQPASAWHRRSRTTRAVSIVQSRHRRGIPYSEPKPVLALAIVCFHAFLIYLSLRERQQMISPLMI
mgnify:CR=1 FL=1